MKIEFSRFRWIVCIATLLLLCVVGSAKLEMDAEQPSSAIASYAFVTEEASNETVISEPKNDILIYHLNTNRWGLSSNTLHLRVIAGQTISFSTLSQRIVRMAVAYLCGDVTTVRLNSVQCHAIASKRFHIGYFIYHRCQMRC